MDHGGGAESKFFHLNRVDARDGQYVLRGDRLGTVGKTGGISTGEHIHWEHRVGGNVVNPNSRLGNPLPNRD